MKKPTPPADGSDKKLSARPDEKPDEKDEAGLPHPGASPVVDLAPQSERVPVKVLRTLHLAMCRANNLSSDIGNCPSCKNPEACEQEVSNIVIFIDDLHEKKKDKKSHP